MLMGEDGARRVVVNSVGREIRTLDRRIRHRGRAAAADDRLRRAERGRGRVQGGRRVRAHQRGAAVVLDPEQRRGARLREPAGVTTRTRSPTGIDRAAWTSLITDDQHPLQDRAIQGRYSPGSTFKMAVALAGLEEGIITPDFKVSCPGAANFYGHVLPLLEARAATAPSTCATRFEQSCDVYFYTVANMVGIDKIHKWATLLGLGAISGIDLPNEVQGLVPSTAWKQRDDCTRSGTRARRSRSASARAQVSVTPISMAVYMATHRQRRHARDAAPAQGDRRRARLEAGAAAGAAVESTSTRPTLQAITGRPVAGGEPGGPADGRARAQIAGARRLRQDRERPGHLEPGARGGRQDAPGTCATTAGSCSSRRATTRRSPASSFSSTAIHGANAARIAHHILDTFFAKKDGRPLPAADAAAGGLHAGSRSRAAHAADNSRGDAGRAPHRASRRRDMGREPRCMFERRLYYHIDWALVAAIARAVRDRAWR